MTMSSLFIMDCLVGSLFLGIVLATTVPDAEHDVTRIVSQQVSSWLPYLVRSLLLIIAAVITLPPSNALYNLRQELSYQTCRSTPGIRSIAAWRRPRRRLPTEPTQQQPPVHARKRVSFHLVEAAASIPQESQQQAM